MSVAKNELGRRLFHDKRLSINEQGSCASCHQQRLAFTDGRAQAVGATGELHARSSMSLVNVAYNSHYTWASRELQTLEQQIPIPLFNVQPVELGMLGQETLLVERLGSDPFYVARFQRAFPNETNPISISNIVKSLACFVRTIVSADSAFDRRLFADDEDAMSASALRGMRLFYSDELHCGACHSGRGIAGGQQALDSAPSSVEFHNTALYNVAEHNEYTGPDPGLRAESNDALDDGKFRAPTLRNIDLTAPYMHDGSIATLSAVLDHYAAGGSSTRVGNETHEAGVKARKSPLLAGFVLSDTDRLALLDFLHSLTDFELLEDPRFMPPAECVPRDVDLPVPSEARC